MFVGVVIGSIGVICLPALQVMMTDATHKDSQGELQGAVASVMGLTAILGPLLMTWVFRHFTNVGANTYFPGAPFVLAALLFMLAVGILYVARRAAADPVVEVPIG